MARCRPIPRLARSEPSLFVALAPDIRVQLVEAALASVTTHHASTPLSPGLPLPRARAALLKRLRSLATVERQHADLCAAAIDEVLERLVADGRLARDGEALRDPAVAAALPAALADAMARLERALDVPAPPPLDEAAALAGCPPEGVRALSADGRIVRLAPDLAWATPTYHRLAALALDMARAGPLSPAALRDATGTSRQFCGRDPGRPRSAGILLRTPEGHVPGPRAPRPTAAGAPGAPGAPSAPAAPSAP